MGLNFGIDFLGGPRSARERRTSSISAPTAKALSVAAELGDVPITEVFDPAFRADQNVGQSASRPNEGDQAVTPELIAEGPGRLGTVDPAITFPSVELVGPKVSRASSSWSALAGVPAGDRWDPDLHLGPVRMAVCSRRGSGAYPRRDPDGRRLRAVPDRVHLTIIAALLTILGYSINDTVVIFDRLRENLRKYKQMPLREMMNCPPTRR